MAEIASYSDLDSRRFGRRIYRAAVERAADVHVLEELAKTERIEMMVARCSVGHIDVVHALEAASYRLMDTLVDYAGPTSPFEHVTWQYAVREASLADRIPLEAIAADAFADYGGHYHADPRLDSALVTAGYVEWCSSCLGKDGFTVWVAMDDARPMGFLAVAREKDFSRVVLNGVASRYRRRGVYDSLLKAAGQVLFRQGIVNVRASTHLATTAPQRIWVRNGMAMDSAFYTFHKWFDS